MHKAGASEAKKSAALLAPPSAGVSHKTPSTTPLDSYPEPRKTELVTSRPLVDGGLTIRSTLDETATCHFIHNFVVGINAPTNTTMDNLAWMYKYTSFDETLTTAVRAVSFASYAHRMRSGELANASRYQYASAIGFTNNALQCPVRAVKDTTLLSILILGMYEVITGMNQRSIKAWMEHVHGSAALLNLRGPEQLRHPIGRRLFVQAMTGILVTSIQLSLPMPQNIMDMAKTLPDMIPSHDIYGRKAYGIHLTLIDANNFRHAVDSKKTTDLLEIMSKSLEIDRRLAVVYDIPNPGWQYTVLTSNDHEHVFGGVYHLYPDLLTANLWNAMRVMRTLLHEGIKTALLRGFAARPPIFTQPEHTAQLQTSMDLCYTLHMAIVASVPQHLGYVKQTGTVARQQHPTFEESLTKPLSSINLFMPSRELPLRDVVSDICRNAAAPNYPMHNHPMQVVEARSSGGLNLMWPLFFAATRDISSPEVQAYCVKILRRIAEEMGIQQALVLAKVVESKTDIEAWVEPRVALGG